MIKKKQSRAWVRALLGRALPALGALALSGCAALAPPPGVPAEVTQALQRAALPLDSLGILAFPLENPRHALRLNEQRPMQPASTMKTVTTVVALDKLGLNSRGKTELLADVPLQGDVLPGALYLRGGADADLDWAALWQLLRNLREQGVREIRGGLVVDRSLFKPARMDIGVPPFDETPEFQYNVIPDALYLNGVLQNFLLSADQQRLSVRVAPAWSGISVNTSAVTLDERPCKDWDDEDFWKTPVLVQSGDAVQISLQGSFPKNCQQLAELNLLDRQWHTAKVVRQIWRELGGVIEGADSEAATPAQARVLATHRDRPLAELVRGMMKSSDNPLTRIIYLRLGLVNPRAAELPRTVDAAEQTVRDWFAAKGIDSAGMVLDNGSGLSRSERIKPAQMAGLLVAASQGPYWPELLTALPIAAVDGTLRNRLKNSPAAGQARLKTGTLNNTVALAGYVRDSQQRLWVVSAMLNDPLASKKGQPVLDALIDWIARQ